MEEPGVVTYIFAHHVRSGWESCCAGLVGSLDHAQNQAVSSYRPVILEKGRNPFFFAIDSPRDPLSIL